MSSPWDRIAESFAAAKKEIGELPFFRKPKPPEPQAEYPFLKHQLAKGRVPLPPPGQLHAPLPALARGFNPPLPGAGPPGFLPPGMLAAPPALPPRVKEPWEAPPPRPPSQVKPFPSTVGAPEEIMATIREVAGLSGEVLQTIMRAIVPPLFALANPKAGPMPMPHDSEAWESWWAEQPALGSVKVRDIARVSVPFPLLRFIPDEWDISGKDFLRELGLQAVFFPQAPMKIPGLAAATGKAGAKGVVKGLEAVGRAEAQVRPIPREIRAARPGPKGVPPGEGIPPGRLVRITETPSQAMLEGGEKILPGFGEPLEKQVSLLDWGKQQEQLAQWMKAAQRDIPPPLEPLNPANLAELKADLRIFDEGITEMRRRVAAAKRARVSKPEVDKIQTELDALVADRQERLSAAISQEHRATLEAQATEFLDKHATLRANEETLRNDPARRYLPAVITKGKNRGEVISDAAFKERFKFGYDEVAQELGFERRVTVAPSGRQLQPDEAFKQHLQYLRRLQEGQAKLRADLQALTGEEARIMQDYDPKVADRLAKLAPPTVPAEAITPEAARVEPLPPGARPAPGGPPSYKRSAELAKTFKPGDRVKVTPKGETQPIDATVEGAYAGPFGPMWKVRLDDGRVLQSGYSIELPTEKLAAVSVPKVIAFESQLKQTIKNIEAKRFKTANDTAQLERAKRTLALDVGRFKEGQGVGWRPTGKLAGKGGQVNRGYVITEVIPETKEAIIQPLRDIGQLADFSPEPVRVQLIDLIRDKRYDLSLKPPVTAPAEVPRMEPVAPGVAPEAVAPKVAAKEPLVVGDRIRLNPRTSTMGGKDKYHPRQDVKIEAVESAENGGQVLRFRYKDVKGQEKIGYANTLIDKYDIKFSAAATDAMRQREIAAAEAIKPAAPTPEVVVSRPLGEPPVAGRTYGQRLMDDIAVLDALTPSQRLEMAKRAGLATEDAAYRSLLSRAAGTPLRKGETWRGRVLRYAQRDLARHPVEAVAVKEPWQMTRDEYRQVWLRTARETPEIWREMARRVGTADQNHPSFIRGIELEQKAAIRQALSEGKPIPPEVLADYPEWAGLAKPLAPEAVPEAVRAAEVAPKPPAEAALVEAPRPAAAIPPEPTVTTLAVPPLARPFVPVTRDQWTYMNVRQRVEAAKSAGLEGKVVLKSWEALSAEEKAALTGQPRIPEVPPRAAVPPPEGPPPGAAPPPARPSLLEQQWDTLTVPERVVHAQTAGLEGRVGSKSWAALTAEEKAALTRQPVMPEVPPQAVVAPEVLRPTAEPPPPGGVPPGAPPPLPPGGLVGPGGVTLPEGTARAISIAEEKVRQAAPGAISRAFDAFPLTRPLYRFFVPARGLTQAQHVAWVARSTATSEYLTRAFAARSQALRALDDAFGPAFKGGAKANVTYMGPVERATGQQADLIGTSVDVLPNPDFYALNPAQRSAIAQVGAYENEFLERAVVGYGAKIGRFPTKEGAAFVPNVDVSESALEVLGDVWRAARVGRAKTRVWEDAITRQKHTPSFQPERNLEVLFAGSDTAKANEVAGEVFRTRLGGFTKLEVMEKTHPKLAAKMVALRKRLGSLRASAGRLETKIEEAVNDFLSSSLDDIDLVALRDSLDVKLAKGPRAGMDIAAIQREINGVRAQIRGLQPYWKAANLKPYVFVQEGVFRYFPIKEAKSLRQLLEVSNNPVLSLAWEIRNIAFNLDLSPIVGVHLPLGFLADPVGAAKQLVRGTRTAVQRRSWLEGVKPSALADDIAKDPASWGEFAAVSGRPVGATATEFAGGILRRIPRYSRANEGMFTLVTRRTKAMFDDMVKGLEKTGIPHDEAIIAASENVHRAIPLVDHALLGQSQARAKLLQSVTISPSFILRPLELMAEAAKALVKAGLKQPLTSKEKMALRIALTLAGTITTISVTTAVVDAYKHGKDPAKAAIDALDDMSIHLLDGRQIPLGGPFRSMVNAMRPRWVNKEMDYMMPFVGVPQWAIGKLTPFLGTQYDLIRGKDFFGKRIVTGDFPVNILEIIRYEFEGAVPLSIAAWLEGWRTGATLEKTAERAGTQLLGTSLYERPGPWRLRGEWRDELRRYWAIPSTSVEAKVGYEIEGVKKIQTRQAFRKANPETDARLFIIGEVESLQTTSAKLIAVRLMKEYNLGISDIRALEEKEFESADRKKLRQYFERALGVPPKPTPAPAPTPRPGPAGALPPRPTPTPRWMSIGPELTTGLTLALIKIWFGKDGLTPEEEAGLREVHRAYPFGQPDFAAWLEELKTP